MTPKLKKIIVIGLIAVCLFLVYAIFFKADPTSKSLIGESKGTPSTEEAKILGTQISQALLRIEQIKLNRDVFDSPIYKSLQDRSRPIEDEPAGRSNPFAPLGDISSLIRSTIRTSSSTIQSILTPPSTPPSAATTTATTTRSVGN